MKRTYGISLCAALTAARAALIAALVLGLVGCNQANNAKNSGSNTVPGEPVEVSTLENTVWKMEQDNAPSLYIVIDFSASKIYAAQKNTENQFFKAPYVNKMITVQNNKLLFPPQPGAPELPIQAKKSDGTISLYVEIPEQGEMVVAALTPAETGITAENIKSAPLMTVKGDPVEVSTLENKVWKMKMAGQQDNALPFYIVIDFSASQIHAAQKIDKNQFLKLPPSSILITAKNNKLFYPSEPGTPELPIQAKKSDGTISLYVEIPELGEMVVATLSPAEDGITVDNIKNALDMPPQPPQHP